ncbi:MAG TPA: hypothetical protein VLA43_12230, partial [Longimicrobiales bacterium]|nr:hypothetical protein [Longimicrobiales bacterium]
MRLRIAVSACALLLSSGPLVRPAAAQSAPPSPQDVLGWTLGERFTDVPSVYAYFHALAEASPRVSVAEYGRSVEGRPLLHVLIASEAHRARLEEILAANRELTDPDTPEARAREIAAA